MGNPFSWLLRTSDGQAASASLRAAAVTVNQCTPQALGAADNALTRTTLRGSAVGAVNSMLTRSTAAAAPLPIFLRYSECVAASVMRPLPLPQGALPVISTPEAGAAVSPDGIERVQVGNGSIPAGEWLAVPLDLVYMGASRVARGIRGLF